MTSKPDLTAKYPIEYEVNIDNFEQGRLFLLSLGCTEKHKVEKIRETWNSPNISGINEIVFDAYPGLAEYIEVDCQTEQILFDVCKLLNLDYENYKEITFSDMYYEQYGFRLNQVPKTSEFTFNTAYANLKKYIKKNKKIFGQIIDEQKQYYE